MFFRALGKLTQGASRVIGLIFGGGLTLEESYKLRGGLTFGIGLIIGETR